MTTSHAIRTFSRARRTFVLLFAALCPLALSGCVAWEIRDEMRTVNQHLKEIDPVLLNTRGLLATVNEDVRQTNARLDAVHAELVQTRELLVAVEGSLKTANPKLLDVNSGLDRMQVLNDVHASLQRVEGHLGPLSRTMGSLGGTLSWLGMGGADTGTDLLASGPDAAEGRPPTGAATTAEASPAARPQRDLLIGTWLLEFPPPTTPNVPPTAFVVKGDGTFIRAEAGKPASTGTWTRQDRTLTLTIDGTNPQPAAKPGQAPTGAPERVELLSVTLRTLTLRRDGEIRVFTRP